MYRFIARSPDGAKRVYGDGPTKDIAESRCRDELLEYIKRRPDWPLSKYIIEEDTAH